MNENTPDAGSKGIARRRLLRGTFAAPAVMTLVSGSAMAATSLSCVVKQQTPSSTAGANPIGTTWIRVPVYRIAQNVNRYALFVAGADVISLLPDPLSPTPASYLLSGQWQCIGVAGQEIGFTLTTIYGTGATAFPTEYPAPDPWNPVPGLYVAVRVDGTGKVVGVEPVSTSATAMSASCWTSFGGANPFKL